MERWRSHVSITYDPRFRRVSADNAVIRPNLEFIRNPNNPITYFNSITNECSVTLNNLHYYYVQSPNSMDSPCSSSGGDSGLMEPPYSICDHRESVDSDFTDHSSSATTGRPNLFSTDLLSNSDCSASSSANGSPFESYESIVESDLMSSFSSCSQSNITVNPTSTNICMTTSTTPPLGHTGYQAIPGVTPTATPWTNASDFAQQSFREGFRASDNMMFDTCNLFPSQLQSNDKIRGVVELNKANGATAIHSHAPPCFAVNTEAHYSGYNLHPFPPLPYNTSSCQGSPVTRLASPFHLHPHHDHSKRILLQKPPLPKRISLPENLQFQPLKLLTFKQSMNVEKQLERNTPADEQKQFTNTAQIPADPVMINTVSSPLTVIQPPPPLTDYTAPVVQHSAMGKAATILHQHRLQSLHQKRSHQLLQKHSRRQIFRQASYHMAQKYSVLPSAMDQSTLLLAAGVDMLRLANTINSPCDTPKGFVENNSNNVLLSTPLSPIEDMSVIEKEPEDGMDTSSQ